MNASVCPAPSPRTRTRRPRRGGRRSGRSLRRTRRGPTRSPREELFAHPRAEQDPDRGERDDRARHRDRTVRRVCRCAGAGRGNAGIWVGPVLGSVLVSRSIVVSFRRNHDGAVAEVAVVAIVLISGAPIARSALVETPSVSESDQEGAVMASNEFLVFSMVLSRERGNPMLTDTSCRGTGGGRGFGCSAR